MNAWRAGELRLIRSDDVLPVCEKLLFDSCENGYGERFCCCQNGSRHFGFRHKLVRSSPVQWQRLSLVFSCSFFVLFKGVDRARMVQKIGNCGHRLTSFLSSCLTSTETFTCVIAAASDCNSKRVTTRSVPHGFLSACANKPLPTGSFAINSNAGSV